ncbi:MAG: hypothetical protein WA941_08210 [Nitrososphaeraceae archaeon]
MGLGFPRSDLTAKYYREAKKEYPVDFQEGLYQNWLSETTAEGLQNFTEHSEKELQSINVYLIPDSNDIDEYGNSKATKGWIVYSWTHYRLDVAGNVVSRSRSNYGLFEKVFFYYTLEPSAFGKQERKAGPIDHIEIGYSLEWTKSNLQKLLKEYSLPKGHKLQTLITAPNGMTFTVNTLQDLMNNVDTPEKLLPSDMSLVDKALRARLDQLSGAPQRPVTATEVQDMIDKQQQQKQPQQKAAAK